MSKVVTMGDPNAKQIASDIAAKMTGVKPVATTPPPTPPQTPPATPPPAPPATPPATPPPAVPPAAQSVLDGISADELAALGIQTPAAPPPATPPPAPPPSQPDLDTSKMSQEHQDDVKRLRERFERQVESLKAELQSAKTSQLGSQNFDEATKQKLADYDAMTQRMKEMETELAKENLARHPQFKAEFDIPMQETVTQIKQYGLTDEQAQQAIALAPRERVKFLQEKAPEMVPYLVPLFGQIDGINMKRTARIANAQHELKRMQDMQAVQVRQFRQQHLAAAIERSLQAGFSCLKDTPQNATLRNLANEVVMSDDPRIQTSAMVQGVTANYYRSIAAKALQELMSLRQKMTEMGASVPRPGAGGAPPPAGAGQTPGFDPKSPKSFMEQMLDITRQKTAQRGAA